MSAVALRLALVLAAALGVTGCAFEAPVSAVPMSYDLGPVRAYPPSNPAIAGVVLVAPVRAPAWLDDDAIAYRLGYEDAARTQVYAMSRWAAEPAALITDRLRGRLAAVARGVVSPAFAARSDFTLRVELEDFSQHFGAPGHSRALLRARATLLATDRRVLLAQRVFEVERAAAPNAQGAVKALTEAADAFVEDLLKWTVAHAGKDAK